MISKSALVEHMSTLTEKPYYRPCVVCSRPVHEGSDSLKCSVCTALDAPPADACGPDCHATHCPGRQQCEQCLAHPHRSTMVEADSLAGPIYLCPDCGDFDRRTAPPMSKGPL